MAARRTLPIVSSEVEALKQRLYLTRTCGECDACCTLMQVDEIDKPADTPCKNLRPEGGCAIYETRPDSCRGWACVWRSGSSVTDIHERPDQVGVMLETFAPEEGVHALLAKETRPGGFGRALKMLERLTKEHVVVLMTWPRNVFGPPDKLKAFLDAVPEAERP